MNDVRIIGHDISKCESVPVEFNVIGWCIKDGLKQLLCDNGFTLGSENSCVDEFIKKAKGSREKKGETFPEFFWNGRSWQEREIKDE